MSRKRKGDLLGRYVHPHVRHAPNRPSEYVNVSEYQEKTDPRLSPVELVPAQGEFDFSRPPGDDHTKDDGSDDSRQ
jgi:hypothetical protein